MTKNQSRGRKTATGASKVGAGRTGACDSRGGTVVGVGRKKGVCGQRYVRLVGLKVFGTAVVFCIVRGTTAVVCILGRGAAWVVGRPAN